MTQITLPEKSILDKAIEFVAPVHAAKRQRARNFMALSGAYLGASTTRKQTKLWTVSRGDADADIICDLPTLRQRSRDLERNAPLAVGAISTTTTHVVGTGLKLQSHTDREVLPLTDEEADAWEANTEREFKLWAESQDCDASRTLTFAEHQELAWRQTLVNGDHFILLPRIPRKDNPYSLTLQHIEADRVINEDSKADTGSLVAGIEKDEYGAPKTYHICEQHPGARLFATQRTWKKIPAYGGNTGLRNIIHLFKVVRAGQTRGVPYLAPVIETIKQIDRYTEAEAQAAVVSSMLTIFLKTDSGDLDLAPTDTQDEDIAVSDIKLGSGTVVGLGKEDSIESVNPLRPNTAFDAFVMSLLRQVGVALELPAEVLIKSFIASYSASRTSLMEAWRFFLSRRQWLVRHFCQEVYEIWLYEAVAIGRISAPGFFSDPIIRKAYCGSAWIGDAPIQIDPMKEVEAAEKRLRIGISTLDEETAALTGGDWATKHPQQVKEAKMRRRDALDKEPVAERIVTEPVKPVPANDVDKKEDETQEDK